MSSFVHDSCALIRKMHDFNRNFLITYFSFQSTTITKIQMNNDVERMLKKLC